MIMLCVDNPNNDPSSLSSEIIAEIDYWITLLFTFEAIFRITALGFFSCSIPGKKAYIQTGSNQIDFIVCFSSLVLLVFNQSDIAGNMEQMVDQNTLKSLKVLRSIRALRLLRVISQNQGLKLAVVSLFGALPAILNGMIVCFLIVFIYAIIGMSLFKG